MLSQKDKLFLRQLIKDEMQLALTIRVKIERNKDMETGQKLAVPFTEEKDIYLPAFLSEYIPYLEGAVRGQQEQVCKASNNVIKVQESVQAMAGIMLGYEKAVMALAKIAGRMEEQFSLESFPNSQKLITLVEVEDPKNVTGGNNNG